MPSRAVPPPCRPPSARAPARASRQLTADVGMHVGRAAPCAAPLPPPLPRGARRRGRSCRRRRRRRRRRRHRRRRRRRRRAAKRSPPPRTCHCARRRRRAALCQRAPRHAPQRLRGNGQHPHSVAVDQLLCEFAGAAARSTSQSAHNGAFFGSRRAWRTGGSCASASALLALINLTLTPRGHTASRSRWRGHMTSAARRCHNFDAAPRGRLYTRVRGERRAAGRGVRRCGAASGAWGRRAQCVQSSRG